MDEILVNNFMVFDEVVEDEHYDLVIGDEAWDVDYFLHENPELKRFAFAWLTDFVGWLPMPDGGDREAALTADYNAEMIEQRARFRRLRDRSVFVGDPDDVVPDTLRARAAGDPRRGPRRTSTSPATSPASTRRRSATGRRCARGSAAGPDERVCVVTVGGSGVGAPLLRRVLDAVPLVRRAARPELRFVVVAGPRIDPRVAAAAARRPRAGYVPDLYRHLAACDVAVVQGGLTTCMELTAPARRSSTCRCGTTSSRTSTSAAASSATAPGRCWPTTGPPTRTRWPRRSWPSSRRTGLPAGRDRRRRARRALLADLL